jgi:putative sigma-54 modulation protein
LNIEITGRHVKITSDIEAYARKRTERLAKFLRPEARVELILDHERERYHAELIITGQRGPAIIGHVEVDNPKVAIDLVVDKVDHQLSKHRDRRKHRSGESMAGEAHPPEAASPPDDTDSRPEDVLNEE